MFPTIRTRVGHPVFRGPLAAVQNLSSEATQLVNIFLLHYRIRNSSPCLDSLCVGPSPEPNEVQSTYSQAFYVRFNIISPSARVSSGKVVMGALSISFTLFGI